MPPLSFRKGLWNCLSPSLEELRCGEEDEQGCQWLRVGSGEAGRLPPPPRRWRRWQGRSEMLGHHPRQAESSGITCCLVWPPMEVAWIHGQRSEPFCTQADGRLPGHKTAGHLVVTQRPLPGSGPLISVSARTREGQGQKVATHNSQPRAATQEDGTSSWGHCATWHTLGEGPRLCFSVVSQQ